MRTNSLPSCGYDLQSRGLGARGIGASCLAIMCSATVAQTPSSTACSAVQWSKSRPTTTRACSLSSSGVHFREILGGRCSMVTGCSCNVCLGCHAKENKRLVCRGNQHRYGPERARSARLLQPALWPSVGALRQPPVTHSVHLLCSVGSGRAQSA